MWRKTSMMAVGILLFLPVVRAGDGIAEQIGGLQSVLDHLYEQMLPMCSTLITVGQAIAGFGALWYICPRIWRSFTNGEVADFYPLFKPFALGLAILFFPQVLTLMNGVLQPITVATTQLVKTSNQSIEILLEQKEALQRNTVPWQLYDGGSSPGDRDKWYQYEHPDDETGNKDDFLEQLGSDMRFAMARASFGFSNLIRTWMSEILEIIYQAAALCINTLRTFNLIVLAILGPIVFGLSVFDTLHHSLSTWFGRYLNVFLWLPVANIFGAVIAKIQELMLQLDVTQVQASGTTFFNATDVGYLIFLLIGIVGYFTVPSVANYIVHVHGGGGLVERVTRIASQVAATTASAGTGGAATIAGAHFTSLPAQQAGTTYQRKKLE